MPPKQKNPKRWARGGRVPNEFRIRGQADLKNLAIKIPKMRISDVRYEVIWGHAQIMDDLVPDGDGGWIFAPRYEPTRPYRVRVREYEYVTEK